MSKNYHGIDHFLLSMPKYRPGRTLVVGSRYYDTKRIDRRSHYDDVLGLDMQDGEGVDIVHDLEQPLPAKYGTFDHVDLVSVLEHVRRPWLLCKNIEAILKPGGSILVSVPFVWRVHGYPSDYWRMTINALEVLFEQIEWQKRGYLMDDLYRKITLHTEIKNKTYMMRSEAVGFGLFIPR